MRWYSLIGLGLIILVQSLSLSGCQACVGDKKGDSDDPVRCDGNILRAAASSASSTDNSISDLVADPGNILRPEAITVAASDNSVTIFKTEVTNEQYASFLKEKGVRAPQSQDGNSNDCHLDNDKVALCYLFTGEGTEAKNELNEDVRGGKAKILDQSYSISPSNASTHPVTYVSWYAAKEYCNVIAWQLPTESQWIFVAGTERTYPWGETPPECTLANFASESILSGYCKGDTQSVNNGTGDTPEGVRHMAGNVFEWTRTSIADDNKDENAEDRVVKGGAWDSGPEKLQNTDRILVLPTSTLANVGFRCVK